MQYMPNKCRAEQNNAFVVNANFSFLFLYPQDQMKGWLGMNRQQRRTQGQPHLIEVGSCKAHTQRSHCVNLFLSLPIIFPGLGSLFLLWLGITDPTKRYQLPITGTPVSHSGDYPWKNPNPRQADSLCHPERFGCQSWCEQRIRNSFK